jgi:hypothetical protein
MFFRRSRVGRDRYLPLRLAALLAGGVLGLMGMRQDNALVVDAAIVVVLAGFLLRFLPDKVSGAAEQIPDSEAPAPNTRSPPSP